MKKNIFIIILAFIVVGLIGFITYDNFFKPQTKCETKETTKEVSKDKTADERYKTYLENLEKSIEEKYEEIKDFDNPGLNNEAVYNKNDATGLGYIITINEKKELRIKYINGVDQVNPDYANYKISDNVLSFYRVHTGNGGYYTLYYITTEGEVYSASIENGVDTAITTKKIENVKNIIEVKEGTSISAGTPIFIDIDGNVITQ